MLLGKACSLCVSHVPLWSFFNHRDTETQRQQLRHCGLYPTFREFSENLEVRTFGVKGAELR